MDLTVRWLPRSGPGSIYKGSRWTSIYIFLNDQSIIIYSSTISCIYEPITYVKNNHNACDMRVKSVIFSFSFMKLNLNFADGLIFLLQNKIL